MISEGTVNWIKQLQFCGVALCGVAQTKVLPTKRLVLVVPTVLYNNYDKFTAD